MDIDHEYVISVSDLSVKYFDSIKFALKEISLMVRKGEIIGIMGPAGAGKTTLALCLNGLIPNSINVDMSGEVRVKGLDTKNHQVADFARYVGMVFQDADAQLFCTTVMEEVGYALSNRELSIESIQEKVRDTLDKVRLSGYDERVPQNLSGGEKQLVAIASVLSMDPEILVLDEPTSQLDPIGTSQIFNIIKRLAENEEITIIIVEHKSEELAEVADRIIVLNEGEICLEGDPRDVFSRSNLIERYGIRPPQISEAVNKLNKKGVEIPFFPIRYGEALEIFSKKVI